MFRDGRQTPPGPNNGPDRRDPPAYTDPAVTPEPNDGRPSVVPTRRVPDVNQYQQKKTLAQGMMDLALLSANANQLRTVIETGSNYKYYFLAAFLISFSLVLQVGVGIMLVWNSQYNINKDQQMPKANKINNITVIGIFAVTVVNVLIAAFGPPGTAGVVNESST